MLAERQLPQQSFAGDFLRGPVLFVRRHGAPVAFALLLVYVLWWGHAPGVRTVDEAMRHDSWIGIIALIYVALQARPVLTQPRSGVMHSLVEIVVARAALATLIHVIIFTWFSLRLKKLPIQAAETHVG